MTEQPSAKRCRVLIIEDEYFLGQDLAKALRLLGCEVVGPVAELFDAMSSSRMPMMLPWSI